MRLYRSVFYLCIVYVDAYECICMTLDVISVLSCFPDIRDNDEWRISTQQKHCLCVQYPILIDKQRFAQGGPLHAVLNIMQIGYID